MIIADGFSGNPYSYTNGTVLSYISKSLDPGSKFEVGDSFYGITYNNTAYLFVIATAVFIAIHKYRQEHMPP